MGQTLHLFCFSFISNTNFTEKAAGVSGIRTWIVGLEGELADHLTTTTTALCLYYLLVLLHQANLVFLYLS